MEAEREAWLRRRFGAMFYDLLILAGLWMVTGAVCLAVTGGQMDVQDPPWWQRVALVAVTLAYFVLSWCRGGQTIGMRAWRLRLRARDGTAPGVLQAAVRVPLACLSLLPLGAGFWWAWLDRRNLTVHDGLCGTFMEKLPKRRGDALKR